MPENPKGHDEDARSDQNSPIQADLDSARNHPPATQSGQTRANNHEAVAEKLEQDIRAGERWLIWIGMTSVLINTVIGWIYWGQLVQMKEATRAAKISADAAAASVKTMRDDQRPWIGISEIIYPEKRGAALVSILPGHDVTYSVRIINYGRTPAVNVVPLIGEAVRPASIPFSPEYGPKAQATQSSAVIFPNVAMVLSAYPIRFAQKDIDAIISRREFFEIYGRIKYQDRSNTIHETTFCIYLSPSGSFDACEYYNAAN